MSIYNRYMFVNNKLNGNQKYLQHTLLADHWRIMTSPLLQRHASFVGKSLGFLRAHLEMNNPNM